MGLDAGAAWRAWRSYRGAGLGVLAFLAARMAVAPLGPLERDFRRLNGRILSLGCGHGVVDRYVAELNPAVSIVGVELDEDRVRIARASEHRAPRVRVRHQDVTLLEDSGAYDGALVVDVLHHVPFEEHARIAASLADCLRPDAICLVKEMATTPRRQYWWNRIHDRLSAGPGPIYCRAPEDLAEVFAGKGFRVEETRRLRRLRLYPQYLISLRRV